MTITIRRPDNSKTQEELNILSKMFYDVNTGLIPHLSTSRNEQEETYVAVDDNEIVGGTTYVVRERDGIRTLTHRAIVVDPKYKGSINKLYLELCYKPEHNLDDTVHIILIHGYPEGKKYLFYKNGFKLEKSAGFKKANGSVTEPFILRKELQ